MVIGRDQYGSEYGPLDPHPRKALLRELLATRAEKMYVDKKDGSSVHIGYVIRGRWITLYKLEPWEKRS